jgi:glycerol-3-phosphate dehydrogenase
MNPTANKTDQTLETEVLIIGGGVTGTGVMRDLALRGVHCILIDRSDLNAGASGGNHGLLHSGGRYASSDTETAAECRAEGEILKRLAGHCIDDCGGLFVAVDGDDAQFAGRFPEHCAAAGIDCEPLSPAEARALEPALSERLVAAYQVPDASVDPFRLTLANVHHAQALTDSRFLPHTEVSGFEIADGSIRGVLCRDTRSAATRRILPRQVVNAAGAWAMQVARLAGCDDVRLLYSKGTLIISNTRLSARVINRLRPPGDGDILVPGGTVSVLGTTSDTVADLNAIRPTVAEAERNLVEGSRMLPGLLNTRFIRAFSGVRPLLQAGPDGADGRGASRGFALFDHRDQGLDNFASVTGGKLTTFRLMAERTGDLVAARLGNAEPCRTRSEPLPSVEPVRWTEPGHSARAWYQRQDPTDPILCECEMVPASVVDTVVDSAPGAEPQMSLQAIGVRSRVGKGSCQGAFCGIRVAAHLYERGVYDSRAGLAQMHDFFAGRFKGVRPVLWGEQMPQMELAEALHCSLLGLDHLDPLPDPALDPKRAGAAGGDAS